MEEPAVTVEDVGRPIDLVRGEARLNRRLVELATEEGRLWERGVRCPIKDRPDTTCSACPVFVLDTNRPLAQLCALGTEQERTLTTLAVERARAQES